MENKVPLSDREVSDQWPLKAGAKRDLFPHHPPLTQICILGGLDNLLGEKITGRTVEFVGELPNSVT